MSWRKGVHPLSAIDESSRHLSAQMRKRALTVTFDPAEELDCVLLPGILAVPQAANTAGIFGDREWNNLLDPLKAKLPDQVSTVLEAPVHERLEVFAKSGLAHQTVGGELLETVVYGAFENYCRTHRAPVYGVDDAPSSEKLLEAAFMMFRLFLQAGNVLVLEAHNRAWFADVLDLAFTYVRPFVCEESTDEIAALNDSLRSSSVFDVIISIDTPSWQPHWSMLLTTPMIKTDLLTLYRERLPSFCDRIDKLDESEFRYLSPEYFDEVLEQDENLPAVFCLFVDFIKATGDVFVLGPISSVTVFASLPN